MIAVRKLLFCVSSVASDILYHSHGDEPSCVPVGSPKSNRSDQWNPSKPWVVLRIIAQVRETIVLRPVEEWRAALYLIALMSRVDL